MQRTAENHAPYQSFPSEQKSQHMQSRPQLASGLLTFVSVLLSDMQAFSMSRCTGMVHKKQLNNPNAKTCKEPCIPSELTKRRITPRCGGVASAFSIELIVPYLYHYSSKTIRGPTRTALRVSCGNPRPDL